MKEYDHKKIEAKWQKVWEKKKIFQASDTSKKPKFYSLIEFPYPSGQGLHVGHIRSNTAMDIISRKRRMEGYNVLYPIGWDAFGLPTENYAIKTGKSPEKVTKENTDNFRRQLKAVGFSFDWSREVNTTDPKYYKWTQWIFLQLLKEGLAYKTKMNINWCPKDKIGLANEEVIGGCCERCGTPVEKREKEQWMLAITKYADRLQNDLDDVDYLEKIKLQQKNWIGKSEGAEIDFAVSGQTEKIKVYTTRPDTLFGVTYVVLAPEHPYIEGWKASIKNYTAVSKYIVEAKNKSDIERGDTKEKTGVKLEGIVAINPANNEQVPVYVADYVLYGYGTGAVMAVPAHDERDFVFAEKYSLPIREVLIPNIIDKRNPPISGKKIVERQNIHALVLDPKTGKYLGIKWRKFPWVTFPMGGVEEGEDVITAARREVLEETGFVNLKFVKILSGQVRAEYFAAHKDENRVSYTTAVVFELEDTTQNEIDPDEKEKHDVVWLDENMLNYEHMTHAEILNWKEKMSPDYACYIGEGILINSGTWGGVASEKAKREITSFVGGKWVTRFKLRDWVFSRQRYWGEPIPVVHCPTCGVVPLPEKELPLKLPKVKKYEPTDNGESPLASISKWVNTKCPRCKGKARRETDTMPQWAGSSWYFLRYIDPKNNKQFADMKKLKHFMQVDWYNGGMEHTTLHLLYSRFWNKFLYDIGVVPFSEPYKKRTSHGMILAGGGEKMSKSKGNVINPDDIVKTFGADTLRLYEMFMGPFDQAIPWNEDNMIGSRRFVERVWRVSAKVAKKMPAIDTYASFETQLHKTIDKVTRDIESMSFNTAISQMMICLNDMEKLEAIKQSDFELFMKILSPFTPHVTEEIWSALGNKGLLAMESWPVADVSKMAESQVTIMIQINGKLRSQMTVAVTDTEETIVSQAQKLGEIQKWLEGKTIKKAIYVPKRLVNFVL